MASCATRKKCFQKFPPQIEVRDSVVVKDSTVYVDVQVEVPGDSVTIYDTIPCPDVNYSFTKKSESGRTTATVKINNGRITVECKIDSLKAVIDSQAVKIKTIERHRSETKVVQAPPVIKYRAPWWSWALLILFIGLFGLWLYRPVSTIIKTTLK